MKRTQPGFGLNVALVDGVNVAIPIRSQRHALYDNEWSAIRLMLRNKPRGVACVDDRRVLNGIFFWVLRQERLGEIFQRSMVPYHLLQSVRPLAAGRNLDTYYELTGRRTA